MCDDRLSELSDDLLRRILYFVPSKEAASTSVLSRRWGSLWRSSGAVNLAVQVYGYQDLWCLDESNSREAFFSKQEAFVHGAKAALDAAEAPITRLSLRVESDEYNAERTIEDFLCRSWHQDGHYKAANVVAAVVSHQAASRVEELRVAAVGGYNSYLYYGQENHSRAGIYELASLPSSDTLRVLDLTMCNLTAAFQLPRLATLRLRYGSVEPNVIQALLDAATELTTVHLESIFFLWPPVSQKKTPFHWAHAHPDELDTEPEPPVLRLRFQAATTLVLALCGGMSEQDSRDQQGRGRSRWAIEIDAPRLQSFEYKGFVRRFILRSAVARVDLHFLRQHLDPYQWYGGDDDDSEKEEETIRMLFWHFLHNFTNARTLKLKLGNDLKDIAASRRASRLLAVFPRVERLELEGVHGPKSKTAAVAIANLLHCCPVLGEIMLKLSTATARRDKGSRYVREFLERKDRSDYINKSMDGFVRRRKPKTTMSSMEDSSFAENKNKYDDVPGIPALSGHSFACLQHTLRRVGLQFRLDNNSLGLRLIKFFAHHAGALEEMCVDTGNRRLDEHLSFNMETQIALAPIPISQQHKNLAESSSEFSSASPHSDSTTDVAKSIAGFTVLPLQRLGLEVFVP